MRSRALQPLSHAAQLVSEQSADATLGSIRTFVTNRGGRLDLTDPNRVVASFGSRWQLRLWGVLLGGTRQRLPLKMHARLHGDGQATVVDVALHSDEGWYLNRIAALEVAYREEFADLLEELSNALRARL